MFLYKLGIHYSRTEEASSSSDPERPLSSEDEDLNRKMKQVSFKPFRRAPSEPRATTHTLSGNYPELHIIGDIASASGFGGGSFTCKWTLDLGAAWVHISGDQSGQTHMDSASSGKPVVWSHPLDVHLATNSIQGVPRLQFQVWKVDRDGRAYLAGYGFSHLPCRGGYHEISVPTWRPMGTTIQEITAYFLGPTPQLSTDELIFNKAWAERCHLKTMSSGKVSPPCLPSRPSSSHM
jgi:B9 domain-containing protein 2